MVAFWVLIKTTVGGGSTAYNFGLDEQYIQGFQQYATNVPKDGQWPNNQIIFDLLMMLYSFCSNLLLINLLIALMSNTYNYYTENSESLLLMEKFNIMCAEENVSAYLFTGTLRANRQVMELLMDTIGLTSYAMPINTSYTPVNVNTLLHASDQPIY